MLYQSKKGITALQWDGVEVNAVKAFIGMNYSVELLDDASRRMKVLSIAGVLVSKGQWICKFPTIVIMSDEELKENFELMDMREDEALEEASAFSVADTITEIPFHHVYYSVECMTGDWSNDGPFFDDVATAFSDGKKYIFDRQGCLYMIVDRSTITGVSVESYHILPREGTKEPTATGKSLGNTDANGATKNVKDIVFWGDGDTFKLISKASSQAEGWMKSTKAMQVGDAGVVVQVTTQQRNPDGSYAVAEALTFVPKAVIYEKKDEKGVVISRSLVG